MVYKNYSISKVSFLMVILSTIFITIAQILLKNGVNNITLTFDIIQFIEPNIIFGLSLYALSAFILIFALKHVDLSIIYPIYATSYIWVTLIAFFYFEEPFTIQKITAIIIIIIGVFMLNKENEH